MTFEATVRLLVGFVLAWVCSSMSAAQAEGWLDFGEPTTSAPAQKTGKQIADTSFGMTSPVYLYDARAAIQAPASVSNAPIGKQSFTLGFGEGKSAPYTTGYASRSAGTLPHVSTSAVDISVTSGLGGFRAGTGGGNNGGNNGGGGEELPPPPGEGYQPCYQHGVFVGYYSPEEVALAQTDFRAALRSFVNSDRYVGGELGRLSILYEIGDISSPFPPGW